MATSGTRYWSVTVSADRYRAERLYDHEMLDAPVPEGAVAGDRVALVALLDPPAVFALGEIRALDESAGADDPSGQAESGPAVIAYTRRFFDRPLPVTAPVISGGPIEFAAYQALARHDIDRGETKAWLVSLDLPIEAASPAEAVRRFWTYVRELGPRELPTYVSPRGDELAMQAYVLGEPANLDPEGDEG